MESDTATKPTTYELAVSICDVAKAKLDAARDVLLTDLVPARLKAKTDFMDFITGIIVSDLIDNHISLSNHLPSDNRLKLVIEIFQKTVIYPYMNHCDSLKAAYNKAKQAVTDIERLEAYVLENR